MPSYEFIVASDVGVFFIVYWFDSWEVLRTENDIAIWLTVISFWLSIDTFRSFVTSRV